MEHSSNEIDDISLSNVRRTCSDNNIYLQQTPKVTQAYSYYTVNPLPKSWQYKPQFAATENCKRISLSNIKNVMVTESDNKERESCVRTEVDDTKSDRHTKQNDEENSGKVVVIQLHKVGHSSVSLPSTSLSLPSVGERSLCMLSSLPKQQPKSASLHNGVSCRWNCANNRNKYKPMGFISIHDIDSSCKENEESIVINKEVSNYIIDRNQCNLIAKEVGSTDEKDEIFSLWFAMMQNNNNNGSSNKMSNKQENDALNTVLTQKLKKEAHEDNTDRNQMSDSASEDAEHENVECASAEHSLLEADANHILNNHKKLSTLTETECGLSHSEELLFIDSIDEPSSPIIRPGAQEKISRDGAHRLHFNTINITEAFGMKEKLRK